VDGRTLDKLGGRVAERKQREAPVFLPVLLVTSRPDVKLITRQVWRTVDELIVTPIGKPELRARVEILLRARALSLALRERAEEAEEAARVRDEVLALVSHDLRNPLNLILTSAELMRQLGPLAPVQEKQLVMIQRAAARMTRLAADLLEVSGVEAAGVAIRPAAVLVGPLIQEVGEAMSHAAADVDVRLDVEAGTDGAAALADHDRIFQVLSNLIDNALKFTPAGGAVRVSAAAEEDVVRFTVADTGPGIAAADLPHVFDRFWQARQTRRGGAGLGLAIARGIIKAHGGALWAENQPDGGSAFHFTLPVAAGGASPGAGGHQPEPTSD
jgi:signal transduction histidine kinase